MVDGHLFTAPNQIPIVASDGFDVCDGAHWVFVMKKIKGSQNPKRDRSVESRLSKKREKWGRPTVEQIPRWSWIWKPSPRKALTAGWRSDD